MPAQTGDCGLSHRSHRRVSLTRFMNDKQVSDSL